MRRILPQLTAAAIATFLATALHASSAPRQATLTITVTGLTGSQVANVSGGQADLTSTVPIGTTGPNGTLSYNPGVDPFLAGKPLVVVVIQCPQDAQLQLGLWPQGQDPTAPMPPGCTKRHLKLMGVLWGKNFTIDVTLAVADTGTNGEAPFYKTPLGIGIIGGAIAAGVVVAAEAGGSSSSGSTTPGSTAPSENTVVNRSVSLTGTFASGSTTCGPPTESGSITFSGTATSTIALITQLLPGVSGATVPGSVSSPSSSAFHFTGSSGTIAVDLTFQVSSDNTTVTVTGTISATGSCPVTYNVTGTFHL